MTHRLQVRVDRQITPRPGRNITRKRVYERSFSVHLLTPDSLNSNWASNPLLLVVFSTAGLLWSISVSFHLTLDIWRLCCLDWNTFHYLQDWAVDTEPPFNELKSSWLSRQSFLGLQPHMMAEHCHVPWMCLKLRVKWLENARWRGFAYKKLFYDFM